MNGIHVGRRCGLFGLGVAVCGALMASAAQDGTRYAWGGTWDANWVHGVVPADGGIARLDVPNQGRAAHSTWKIDVNRTGIRLGGFDFGAVGVAVEGSGDITYVGANPFIRIDYLRTPWNTGEIGEPAKWYPEHADAPNNSYCYRTCHYRLPIRGTGDNRLTLNGAGEICIDRPISDFAEVEIRNVLMATNPVPDFAFTTCDTTLTGEVFYWPLAGGDVSAGLATDHALTAGAGASLVVRNTKCSSATLALGTLRRGLKGTLTIQAQMGTLGGAERVTVAGTVPAYDDGLVEPWIVGRDAAGQAHFLAYDAAVGFCPFEPTATDLAAATENDIVCVSVNVTLSESRKIRGLVIANGATLTLADGVTLTVGGVAGHAAAVIVNAVSAATYTPITGQNGTLDFGASEGFIWLSAHWTPTANDALVRTDVRLGTPVRGAAGVTLAGARAAVDHNYLAGLYATSDFNFCRWTGGTTLANVYLRASISKNATVKENPFTDCGELYVVGGETVGGSALRFNTANVDTDAKVWMNDLYLAGGGYQGRKDASDRTNTDDTNGSIVQDGGGGRQRVAGRVTLVGNARVVPGDDSTAGFAFEKPIEGTGSLSVWQTQAQTFFDAVNTFRGKTVQVGTGAGVLSLRGAGTFGDGPAELEGNLQFADQTAPYVVTNQVTVGGDLELVRANVQFAGRTSVAGTARVYGTTSLVLGEDVVFGALHAGSTLALAGATPDVRLVLAGDGDSYLDTVAAGTLPVVKKGTGTLTVHATDGGRTAVAAATAPVIEVAGGTLALESDILKSPGLVYWMDASDAATLETDPTTGNVVKWNSKNGNGYYFAAPRTTPETMVGTWTGYGAQTGVQKVNGLNVLTFTPGSDSRNGLVGSRPVSQRTVFVVNVPRLTMEGQCLFGTTADYSFRSASANRWRVVQTRTNYESSGGSYVNGAWTTTGDFENGKPQIVTVRHPVDVRANSEPETPTYLGRDYERLQLGFQYLDVRTSSGFEGDIAEVLAFDTVLSDDERKAVENYLAKKWGIAGNLHADGVAATRSVMDPATTVRLGSGTVFDLNGHDQTIAALSGCGRIVNGAGGAAPVLTVTGPCDFDGVAEGVTLRFAGGARLGAFGEGVPTNGLLYRLDASRPATLLVDANGCVTNWASRFVGGVAFDWKSGHATSDRTRGPVYQASCDVFDGRPGVVFDGASLLKATASTRTKTLFAVWNWADTVENTSRPWESSAGYVRKFVSSQYGDNVGLVNWTRYGDRVAMNGVPKVWGAKDAAQGDSLDQWAVPAGGTFLYSARLDASRAVTGDGTDVLNAAGKGGYTFGEVLAYDRCLSDDECRVVEAYLTKKWLGEGGIPSEGDDVRVEGDVEIVVGADGTVHPVVVDGTLDAADATLRVVNAAVVPKGVRQDLVVTDGIRRGFARVSSDREDLFEIVLKGLAYIGRSLSGLYLIFR